MVVILIVGAGQAAVQTAASLRLGGFDGEILLVGEEEFLPYQRPPLSKAYLKGELDEERLFIKPAKWFEENKIEVLTNTLVESVDVHIQSARLSTGQVIAYDNLVFATGGHPRQLTLPGRSLDGILTLRSITDVNLLKNFVGRGKKIGVVGAGYIGLETAAVCVNMGCEVTVLEASNRILSRVTGNEIASALSEYHLQKGVDIKTEVSVAGFSGENGHVQKIHTMSHGEIEVDAVLVGVGIIPNQGLAQKAGIACDSGILVDEDCKTTQEGVFAVGDCASRPLINLNSHGRIESVHNAIEQGKLAANAILNKPRAKVDPPWFWSDQYDLKLQTVGLFSGYDNTVIRGLQDQQKFSVWYYKGDTLLAVDAINSAPDFLSAKKMLSTGISPDKSRIADSSQNLKELF